MMQNPNDFGPQEAGASEVSALMQDLRATLDQTRGKPLRDRLAGFEALFPYLFRNMNLENEDLSGQDLRGIDFSGANLTGARLNEAQIDGAQFWQARVTHAQLRTAADWPVFAKNWSRPEPPMADPAIPGDRIVLDPLGPEFVVLAPPDPAAACPEGVASADWEAWCAGRLAVARAPVTLWESRVADGRIKAQASTTQWRPALFSPDAVPDYLDRARRRMTRTVDVPSAALWRAIAHVGGVPDGVYSGRAITADSNANRLHPEPIPTGDDPRVNALGLVDMVGNVREFVRADDDKGVLLVIGGAFSDSLSVCLKGIARPTLPERAVGKNLAGLRLMLRLPPHNLTGQAPR